MSNIEDVFREKYLKYKAKYLSLKEKDRKFGGKNTKVYIIVGLGCASVLTNDREIQKYKNSYAEYSGISSSNIIVVCRKTIHALTTIASTYLNIEPFHNSKFINDLANILYDDAMNGNKVLVYAHSYGGAIANKVAVELNKKENISSLDLFIATFGSIYIVNYANKVKLLNYIQLGDVAFKLNKIKDDVYDDLNKDLKAKNGGIILKYNMIDNNIIRVCNYNSNRDLCLIHKKGLLVGSKDEWKIHNSYTLLMLFLMRNKTNDIQDKFIDVDKWPANINLSYQLH